MSEEIPNLEKLIKLMQLTRSDHDSEALSAIRMANRMLDRFGGDWEKILLGKVTVIGDPFANTTIRPPVRNARPVQPQPAPKARPAPASPWVQPKPKPQPTPKPTFDPNAAQPAQPIRQMGFVRNADGHWRVKSNKPLVVNDIYEIPTRNGQLRRVRITGADGTNTWGDYLYFSVNAPLNVGDIL